MYFTTDSLFSLLASFDTTHSTHYFINSYSQLQDLFLRSTILTDPIKYADFLFHKNNSTVYCFRNIQCRYFYFQRYTKQNIFLYTIISNGEFDLFSFSGAAGSRTPVRTQIQCTSTVIVSVLTFPPSSAH